MVKKTPPRRSWRSPSAVEQTKEAKEKAAARWLCEEISMNDPSIKELHFSWRHQPNVNALRYNLPLFLSSLKAGHNTHLSSVVIDVSTSQDLFPNEDDLNQFVEHLGYCRGLKHLEISAPPQRRSPHGVKAQALARFLRLPVPIETLILKSLVTITPACLYELNEALHKHPTLQTLELSRVLTLSSYPNRHVHMTETTLCLSSLLSSIATIPNLTHLQICSSEFWGLDRSDNDKTDRVGILSNPSCAEPLAQLLVRPGSGLETLVLRHVGLKDCHAPRLAQALTQNRSLQRLDLRSNPHLSADAQRLLIDALIVDHCDLRRLELDWHVHQTSSFTATSGTHATALVARAAFHTRLNRAGRARFLPDSNATHAERVDLLVQCNARKESVSVLLGLLLQNPSILEYCRDCC